MIRKIVLSCLLSLALLSPAVGQTFLPEDCSDLINMLPPPPDMDSPAGRADLATLIQVQADRTPEQVKRAKRVATQSVTSFARPVLGEWFRSKDFPKTIALFKKIDAESQRIVDDEVKRRWHRPRPYIFSSEVHPIVGRPNNTSYPSGHSAAAALWGTLLSAAFPDKAEEFQAQVREATWCRVLGGVHFPSDTMAGEMLGTAIAKKMLESPEMQKALETIREEINPYLKAAQTASKPEAAEPVAH